MAAAARAAPLPTAALLLLLLLLTVRIIHFLAGYERNITSHHERRKRVTLAALL